jgi:hypothetical protein
MEAAEFRLLVRDKRLATLFDYWLRIRGARPMPDWADIRAEELAAILPHIWVWQTDDTGQPRLRIVGETIMQIMEYNLKGKTPGDIYHRDQAQPVLDRLTRVMTEPSCAHSMGTVYSHEELIGVGERLSLPYFDGKIGRPGVIGASVIDKTGSASASRASLIYSMSAEERYFSLR